MDSLRDRLARAGMSPDIVTRVAGVLAARWDPDAEYTAPDGERMPEVHAAAVLGILGAGGPLADVVGYLRRAEEERLVFPRSTGATRWQIAEEIRAIVLGPPAEAPPAT